MSYDGQPFFFFFFLGSTVRIFHRPKDSRCDPDLVEVYAPTQGPESEEQFIPRSACVFIAITNGGGYTPVCLPYVTSIFLTGLILERPSRLWA
jgi:hypothetical protein